MLTLLASFYEVTKMLSSATYATLNMVYCTMCYLKKKVAPPEGQNEEYYENLLYEVFEEVSEQDLSALDNENTGIIDINQPLIISRGRTRRCKNTRLTHNTSNQVIRENVDPRFKNHRVIEAPVITTNILEYVKATIYLSMCQYWDVPKEVTLLAALLDPWFKKLKFVTKMQRDTTIDNLRQLYRIEQAIILEESADSPHIDLPKPSPTNKIANAYKVNYSLLGMYEDSDDEDESNTSDEVTQYLALPKEVQECDPLEWWKARVNIFPTLSRLAMKYLSIPATSVPSERLFSDVSLHLSARRTCLKPELLGSMLFLKRNMKLFDIFRPKNQ